MLDSSISAGASAEAISPVLSVPAATTFKFPWKSLKIVVAGGALCAGAFGILSENKYVATSDAVVSTYVLAVRTPIDGTVSGLPISSGIMVRAGESLGELENPLADHQHLDNLRNLEDEAEATDNAVSSEQKILAIQRDELMHRSVSHLSAVKSRLSQQVVSAEQVLHARQLAFDESRKEGDRARQLYSLGIMSQADYDKLISAEGIAEQQLSAEQADVASVKLQLASATQGILIEPGTDNDVPYSRQRADELSIKLADNERILATSRMQAREAEMAVVEEAKRTEMMQHSNLSSPIDGLIWKLNAVNGEHAAAGDTVVSLVDCRRQFILAEIPQNRVPDIALHQKATFRLAGEAHERSGTVLSVSGDSLRQDEASLAALPNTDAKKELALVLIGIDNPAQGKTECLVGRDARVLVPTVASSPVVRWFRGYF